MISAFTQHPVLVRKFKRAIAVVLFTACLFMGGKAKGQVINTIAGDTEMGFNGDGVLATAASLYLPQGVAVDKQGNVYIADTWNNRVRKIDVTTGIITTIAGAGNSIADSVPATTAELYQPIGIAVDDSGYVFITDGYRNRVRKISPAGIITTVAGKGNTSPAFSGDNGPATQAEFFSPFGIALDDTGNVYITDEANNRLRKVDKSTGIIHTIAGTGVKGYMGDGGAATSAQLNFPTGVAIDKAGNIFVTQSFNGVIRKINGSTGIISTIAGNGVEGFAGDGGPAINAEFNNPAYIVLDDSANIYVGDLFNAAVRKISAATGIVTTVAGDTTWGFGGDGGPATSAELNEPSGLAIDACHNLYITERGNNRVRKVTPGSTSPFTAFTASATTVCTGQVILFTDTSDFSVNKWSWQFTGSTPDTSSLRSPSVIYYSPGAFEVTLNVSGTCGHASETMAQYIIVGQSPAPAITPAPAVICQGQPLTLRASGATTYQWVGTTNSTNTITVSPLRDTTYQLQASNGNCVKDTAIAVKVNALPLLNITPLSPTYCFGTGAHFTASGGIAYTWSPSTGLTATTGTAVVADPSATTTYTVTATGATGCTASTTDVLTILPAPTIGYSYSSTGLAVNFTSDSATGGVTTYTWDFGDSSAVAHGATTTHTYAKAGNYYSCLTVYNNSNCSFTRCQYVDLTKTGVRDISGETNFQFYPNPAGNKLLVNSYWLSGSSIEVTNSLGQTLITQVPSSDSKQTIMDISSLSSGVYLLVVKNNDGVGVRKFVKE